MLGYNIIFRKWLFIKPIGISWINYVEYKFKFD